MLLRLLFGIFLSIQFITRTILYGYAYYLEQVDFSLVNYFSVVCLGVVSDLATFVFFAALISILRLFITKRIASSFGFQIIGSALLFCYIISLNFNIIAELLFWDEFSTRFNFIAVDYLVYTREVVGNIVESYPVYRLLAGIFLISICFFALIAKTVISAMQRYTNYRHRLFYAVSYSLLSLVLFFSHINLSFEQDNRYQQELTKNGIASLFIAFKDNTLNYEHFYQTRSREEVFANLRKMLLAGNQQYLNDNIYDLSRKVVPTGPQHKYNIMLISVESLSADYFARYGNDKKLTPFLDELFKESLVFDRYFAVGTRTVRGLEAMTLSTPPVPGNAIVRRPNNEKLSTIGHILAQQDYDNKFIYGGYGYFDNMNYYFANNNFNIIDRQNIAKEDIIFENIWGVADEVLFNQALKEADKSYSQNKPFFSLVMTTSNHRPYTYPDNRVAIPSGTGRDGGVQYTDYAIKQFIEQARTKEWFKDTIFVITADHCAASAGKQDLPVSKYHIPLLIYAPGIIKPGQYDAYMSQIDLAPTILGLLNIPYVSKFFGNDALYQAKERIFIATYQKLGYMVNNQLAILSPKQQIDLYNIASDYSSTLAQQPNQELVNQAIDYYQGASQSYDQGLLKQGE